MNVKYGSIVHLKHISTGAFLKSLPKRYSHPRTSGQQMVVGSLQKSEETQWLVKGEHALGNNYPLGSEVAHGHKVRLEHIKTGTNLHSHDDRLSPVSGQQEVTCIGTNGVCDINDDWVVDIDGGGIWKCDQPIRLIHERTDAALHSHADCNNPVFTNGEQEVTGFSDRDANDLWVVLTRDNAGIPPTLPVKSPQSFEGIRIGGCTYFNSTATAQEAVLDVKSYASVLAKLLRTADDKDLCLAIFGPWGRGKSFLKNETIQMLQNENKEFKDQYEVVEFSAWKYPSKPEVWIHLYEMFFCKIASGNWFKSLPFIILTGLHRRGVWPLWFAWVGLMLTAVPKGTLFEGIRSYFGKFDFAVASTALLFISLFLWRCWTTSSQLRRHYFSGIRHGEKLGLQATIGEDLKAMLKGWIQVDLKSKSVRKGLRLLFLCAIALSGAVVWRCYKTTLVWIVLLLLIWMGVIIVWGAFKLARPSPGRILLVVDDLDRCEFGHLLSVVESIKLLLEETEIAKRVQVMMLVEEEILAHALFEKYKILLNENARKDLKTKYDPQRLIRENVDKLFTLHFRLGGLATKDIIEVVMAFGGRSMQQTDPSTTKPPTAPVVAAASSKEPVVSSTVVQLAKRGIDPNVPLTEDEKSEALAALQLVYGDKLNELGPRAIRAFLFRYQLGRLILQHLGVSDDRWDTVTLARLIASKQKGEPFSIERSDQFQVLASIAEAVG